MNKKLFERKPLRMNLQLFGEEGAAGDDVGTPEAPTAAGSEGEEGATTPTFDYDKLANLIAGKQTVAEDTVLKNYFKQKGLTQDEATKAINSFKEQKAANTPDIEAMQNQVTQAQALAVATQLELDATKAAMSLGIDAQTLPYVLKMADMSDVAKDGKNDPEKIKAAITKVLEDVPGLKKQEENAGFRIGSGSISKINNQTNKAIPTKRWNKFN